MIDNDWKMDEMQKTLLSDEREFLEEVREACRQLERDGLLTRVGLKPGIDGRLQPVGRRKW